MIIKGFQSIIESILTSLSPTGYHTYITFFKSKISKIIGSTSYFLQCRKGYRADQILQNFSINIKIKQSYMLEILNMLGT
jgi:hypothetical protein